ncbi:MAG TPA: S8 family serine peptidase [Gaiellaceae bacterium]|jgi:subtilisin family serine protease
MNLRRRLALVFAALVGSLSLLATSGAGAAPHAAADPTVEVVVTLPQPPLGRAILGNRTLAAATMTHHKLNLRAPASVSYLRTLASAQRTLQSHIQAAIPQSSVRWHYSVVANGIAVTVPRSDLHRLSKIPGATVWPSVTYHEQLDRTPKLIGATTVWGPTLATAGNGIKIGIIDDGIDQTHVFFDPASFSYPAGFPKGQTAYTTPKVIAARAFAPASTHWKYANTPFDPDYSDHATNVAGIAGGDYNTLASIPGSKPHVSGIAPNAYLGNYKVLTVPTTDFGLDGNSPEIVKGIDAAVADGMDVINLSLGEPEIEPSRDIVVAAINSAADAGVVPVIAAGNDFADAGKGSVGSPGTATKAITVAASSEGDNGPADVIAGFSSAGPTPISLLMKPDVTAPGVDILSSLPDNTWSDHDWSGTSMASPHVAGAAAVLKQRHPSWTVEQIKSALESTGDPVHPRGSPTEVSTLREGGGRIDLPRADQPLIFSDPTGLSFGLVRRGTTTTKQLALTDAGGGSAPWTTSIAVQTTPTGASFSLSSPTAAAGSSLGVTLTVSSSAAEGDATGFVELTRGTDVRRIPYWVHVEVPKLGLEKAHVIAHRGVYGGTTVGGKSLVSTYRYPENGLACNCATGVPLDLSGPEQVFQLTVTKPVANIGGVILSRAKGVRVTVRLVVAGDENRLTGYDGLPVNLNPYQDYGRVEPAVAAIAPAPGKYDLVFDTPAGAKPGRFTFRVWSNDVTPPSIRILARTLRRGAALKFAVTDSDSGVDVGSIKAKVDGRLMQFVYARGVLRFEGPLKAGTHRYTLTVSDYEEAKNMENVGPILPNTRSVSGSFVAR